MPWTYVINDLNGEKNCWEILPKWIAKNKSKEFRIEKVIKRKGNKLYVKWKGKLVPVSVDLSKLSDIVKNDLVEKL